MLGFGQLRVMQAKNSVARKAVPETHICGSGTLLLPEKDARPYNGMNKKTPGRSRAHFWVTVAAFTSVHERPSDDQ